MAYIHTEDFVLLTDYWKQIVLNSLPVVSLHLLIHLWPETFAHGCTTAIAGCQGCLLVKSTYLAGDGEGEEGLFLKDAAKKSQQTRAPCAVPCKRNSASQIHGKEGTNVSLT